MDRTALVVLLVAVALAGCLGGSDGAGQASDGTDDDDGPELSASLDVDDAQGVVPHAVNFTIDASPSANVTAWELDFGDGNVTDGTTIPAEVPRNYSRSGRFVASLSITFDGSRERTDQIAVLVQPPPPPDPIQKAWNASALVGLPHPERLDQVPYEDPGPSHAEIAHEAYLNGGNGTTVVGFEVTVSERYGAVVGFAQMQSITPPPPAPPVTPDYDLFLFAPNGSLADASQTNNTVEIVRSTEVVEGDWLLLVAYWGGADLPAMAPEDPVPPARAVFAAS